MHRVRDERLHGSEASTVIGWAVVFGVAAALLFGAFVFHRAYWGGAMAAMMAGSAVGLVIVAAAWKALT